MQISRNLLAISFLGAIVLLFWMQIPTVSADTKLALDSRTPGLDDGKTLPPATDATSGSGSGATSGSGSGSTGGSGGGATSGSGSGATSGSGSGDGSTQLMSPIEAKSIGELFYKIIDVLLVFAIPIIVLYIMYGGFKLVTAGGESGKIEEGRTMIMWAIVGGVILLGAKVIVEIIQQLVDSL